MGIQRFADPNEFGIDFIRNGRKILIQDKSLFSFTNPLTGTSALEYPVDLGSTVGGRIVGEIHVDYLIPTYQKNDFDKTDASWDETVIALRGAGPILPKQRKAFDYDDSNTSPIGSLANAYRRTDKGTKHLFVEKAVARGFREKFLLGDPEYLNDDKWWEAAREADREKSTKNATSAADVDEGVDASDNPDEYGPATSSPTVKTTSPTSSKAGTSTLAANVKVTSTRDELMRNSRENVAWSRNYSHTRTAGFNVKVWELTNGRILQDDESIPCTFFLDGIECDFVFNPRHPLLTQFPVDPRQLLAVYLAEKFNVRDSVRNVGRVFSDILQLHMQDMRIDKQGLMERSSALFDALRDRLTPALSHRAADVVEAVHEASGDVEETIGSLLSEGDLLIKFQAKQAGAIQALRVVPNRTLLRIVDRFPEDLFDGKVFRAHYENIALTDANATNRMRTESKDRIMSFLKDALWVMGQTGSNSEFGRGKAELARSAHSISFLEEELDL